MIQRAPGGQEQRVLIIWDFSGRHVLNGHEAPQPARDLIGGALDTYLSVTSNRINEIMKVLTVVTVALMPPTLVASFYGMNFANLPLLTHIWGWVFAFALIVLSFVGPLLYLRQRGWWWERRTEDGGRRACIFR